ncbi:hypothetical protein [Leifsonia sp. Leaf264]|uniref:hypothetical protein n=1 Tax=Leifsonia sp. Leaf264 TaxID=1736314 RepID=UPI0006FE66FE|nr:hypothetical protein [Leifsonia sp. Leaf264]KQO97595.1 hypothetical protein ASF30_14325 [Leifsonia sp. Leaf264]
MDYAKRRAASKTKIDQLRARIRALRTQAGPSGGSASDPSSPSPGSDQASAAIAALELELTTELDARSDEYLHHVGSRTWRIFVGIAGFLIAAAAFTMSTVPTIVMQHLWSAAAATVLTLGLLAIISRLTQPRGLIGVLIGKDGRFSTSSFQAWIWTVVLAWAFIYLVFVGVLTGHWVPAEALPAGTDGLPISADYLLLLGGPFAALVLVQQIDSSKVAAGDLQKVPTGEPQIKDLVSNDAGTTDLIDTQYLVFNTIAVVVFAVLLFANSTRLPDLPEAIVILTSASALGYVGKKAVQKNSPSILTIVPDTGSGIPTVGARVRVRGTNFIPPGADVDEKHAHVWVRFGTVVVPAIETDGQRPALSPSEIIVDVPAPPEDGLDSRLVDVVVVTAAGVETDPYQLQIVTPFADASIALEADGTLAITVEEDVPEGTRVRVGIDGYVEETATEADHRAIAIVPAGVTGAQMVRISYAGSTTTRLINL